MNIELTARHYEIADRARKHLEEEMNNLKLYEDLITSCKVIMERTKDGESIDISVHVRGKDLLAQVTTEDMIKSIDLAVAKIERQLKKFKEKRYAR
ncbi:MAG TPA: ribosome-associated translation inhibitor RaiA [Candidatus Marinimicrobia bacterium]|nr:ribosome-associated translation inhibitor RaiA [Candidatus Neomarinimicrobiota bacterium]HRS51490.1 ribosome-associated translation inhibitor RaiA [Candidatus Neomarinimicrobiota bacterium]HRU92760.1 ribosome-associated translation inhibitor RaiA [Candidatus Neomarinimicrobiota bacterium]